MQRITMISYRGPNIVIVLYCCLCGNPHHILLRPRKSEYLEGHTVLFRGPSAPVEICFGHRMCHSLLNSGVCLRLYTHAYVCV